MIAKHPLADCANCPLNGPENAFVPTRYGAAGRTTLVVVGEAPGYHESLYGQPFVGPSGTLLKKVLKHYGYRPSEVTFTNACLCRPPGNATPPKAAVNACHGRLVDEIVRSGASDVLALGGTAVSTVVDDRRAITTLRVGPPKGISSTILDAARRIGNPATFRVVPTWHPAYTLRTADAFPTMVSDIGKLRKTNLSQWKPPKWVHADEVGHAIRILEQVRDKAAELVIDIEVGMDKDTAFIHPNNYDLLCVGMTYADDLALVLGEEPLRHQEVKDGVREVFRSKRLIGHNGKFDLEGLYPHVGALQLYFDTMLAHYALDERPGTHGLKILAVEELGAPKYDDEIKRYVPARGNYANIPRPILYQYNAYDVACTWQLYKLFQDALDRDSVRHVHDFMVRASNELMYMELNGIAIDRAYSYVLESSYLERLASYEDVFNRLVTQSTSTKERLQLPLTKTFEDLDSPPRTTVTYDPPATTTINPRSPKQIKEYLLTQGIVTESTNVDHLTALLGKVNPLSSVGKFITELLKYRREAKLYGTYIKGIRQRTYRGRVYTTYLLHGSTSGRLASRNPNLQNIVRDKSIRQQFSVSSPDNVFIQLDYKNAEARVMATMAQDEYLRHLLSNPDPNYKFFNELSDQLYGAGNWDKEKYVRTKAFFYGIGYGREAFSIAMEFGMTKQEADRLYYRFTSLIPNVVRWQNDVKRRVLDGEVLVTPFGRKRRFALITDANRRDVLNEALSFLPQSTASDICLDSLVHIRPRLKGIGWLRMTIHDALVAECPEANKDKVIEIMREEMMAAGSRYTDYVPFGVDISVGKHWGEL